MAEEYTTIVVDNGSSLIKAGFSGEEAPKAIFPSIVGRPKNIAALVGVESKDAYVGEYALSKRGILNIS